VSAAVAQAAPQTVCTITVNSSDEREAFRRNLPPAQFDVVELLDARRPDWLAAACRKRVRCDVLVISGHFDDGSEFYSDRHDAAGHLPVAELERAACSDGCGELFSHLREVYLFGCNTLNADALKFVPGEALRGLVRTGNSAADAAALARDLEARHGESNRDRMRTIFKDVPVIYGFSSKAPLGASAGPMLGRYLKTAGAAEVGQGTPSARLLALFAPASMQVAAGVTDSDTQAGHRRDVCALADDAPPLAARLRFVHALLRRGMAEVALLLDRLDAATATLDATSAAAPAAPDESTIRDAVSVRAAIAADATARSRFLETARDADRLATTVRMLDIAQRLGWLSQDARQAELVAQVDARARRQALDAADVDVVCTANQAHALEGAAAVLPASAAYPDRTATAAALACLGRAEARAKALRALTSARDADAEVAQVYLRHRPLTDAAELRELLTAVARTREPDAQVRALDTMAPLRVSDRESLQALAALYPHTRSPAVQRAIAGVLIRADASALDTTALARALREHRLATPGGPDAIDVLIRRLQPAT